MSLTITQAGRKLQALAPADGATVLTLYALLLLGLPSRLIFAPLGGAGTPAQILGMGAAAWWLWDRIADPRRPPWSLQPVRMTSFMFLASLVASFAVALSRPTASDEIRSAQLGLLLAISWIGILLLAHDGPMSLARLDTFLARLALGAGLLAALGIAQFLTGRPLTNYIDIPGLTLNNTLVSLSSRSGFNRPAGTALHAIEFGVVITALLPICLHYAMFGRRRLLLRWFPVAAIAFAVPIAVSRSAIVCAAVALAVLAPAWNRKARRVALVAVLGLLSVVFVAIPGMLGTLSGLFLGVATDSSARSRTDSYDLVWDFFIRAPVFGRGFATFLPAYRILDNQYLGLLIDAGLVGLASFLVLIVTGIVCAWVVKRTTANPQTRHLAQALCASLSAAGVGYALFDGFAFPMFSGLTFLLLGCSGCLWRLTRAVESTSASPSAKPTD